MADNQTVATITGSVSRQASEREREVQCTVRHTTVRSTHHWTIPQATEVLTGEGHEFLCSPMFNLDQGLVCTLQFWPKSSDERSTGSANCSAIFLMLHEPYSSKGRYKIELTHKLSVLQTVPSPDLQNNQHHEPAARVPRTLSKYTATYEKYIGWGAILCVSTRQLLSPVNGFLHDDQLTFVAEIEREVEAPSETENRVELHHRVDKTQPSSDDQTLLMEVQNRETIKPEDNNDQVSAALLRFVDNGTLFGDDDHSEHQQQSDQFDLIQGLMAAAERLKSACATALTDRLTPDNAIDALTLAQRFSDLVLRTSALKFIAKNQDRFLEDERENGHQQVDSAE